MVGVRLLNGQEVRLAVGISQVGVVNDLKTADEGGSATAGVIDVEIPVLVKGGVKGQAQQALLIARVAHAIGDVQQRHFQKGSSADDADTTGLFDDKQPVVAGVAHKERTLKSLRDQLPTGVGWIRKVCNAGGWIGGCLCELTLG